MVEGVACTQAIFPNLGQGKTVAELSGDRELTLVSAVTIRVGGTATPNIYKYTFNFINFIYSTILKPKTSSIVVCTQAIFPNLGQGKTVAELASCRKDPNLVVHCRQF